MKSVFLSPAPVCPDCGTKLDAHSGVGDSEGATPRAGSLVICSECGALLVFTEDLNLRLLTQKDREEFAREQPDALLTLDRGRAHVLARNARTGGAA